MNGFPAYSKDASFSLDEFFYPDVNDVNFYFEDENHENFYELLLQKLYPDIKIVKVFCLGGKSEVLKKVKENDSVNTGIRCIYILDKDYDDLTGKIVSHNNIIYLPKYSIENFLFDPSAILSVLVEEIKKSKKNDLEQELDLNKFYDGLIQELTVVAKHFIVTQKNNVKKLKTAKLKFNEFLTISGNLEYKVCHGWLNKYRQDLLAYIQHFKTLEDVDVALNSAFTPVAKFQEIAEDAADSHICGKHILSVVIDYLVKKKSIKEFDQYLFSIRLLGKIDIVKFNFLKEKIQICLN